MARRNNNLTYIFDREPKILQEFHTIANSRFVGWEHHFVLPPFLRSYRWDKNR